jgi:hypothetical protein
VRAGTESACRTYAAFGAVAATCCVIAAPANVNRRPCATASTVHLTELWVDEQAIFRGVWSKRRTHREKAEAEMRAVRRRDHHRPLPPPPTNLPTCQPVNQHPANQPLNLNLNQPNLPTCRPTSDHLPNSPLYTQPTTHPATHERTNPTYRPIPTAMLLNRPALSVQFSGSSGSGAARRT